MTVQIIFGEGIETSPDTNGVGGGNANALINPTLAFALPFVPSGMSFAASVLTKGINLDEPHKLQFVIREKQNGKEVSTIDGNAPIQPSNPLDTFNFNLNFRNVPFKSAGEHELVFSIDGTEKGKQSFWIVHVPQ